MVTMRQNVFDLARVVVICTINDKVYQELWLLIPVAPLASLNTVYYLIALSIIISAWS